MVPTACPGSLFRELKCIHVGRILLSMLIRLPTKQTHKKNFERNLLFLVEVLTKRNCFSKLKVSSIKSVNKSKHFNFAETAFLNWERNVNVLMLVIWRSYVYCIPPCCTLRQSRKGCSTGLFLGAWEPARAQPEFRIQVGLLPTSPHSTDLLQFGPFM